MHPEISENELKVQVVRCDSWNEKGENNKNSHSGKCHQCDVCQKSFMWKESLTRHKRLHSGKSVFTCEMCEKTFYVKAHLLSHIIIHTGEKPFTCEICQKGFSQKSFVSDAS